MLQKSDQKNINELSKIKNPLETDQETEPSFVQVCCAIHGWILQENWWVWKSFYEILGFWPNTFLQDAF